MRLPLWLRWSLLPSAIWLSCFSAIVVGLALEAAAQALCPPALVESGHCMAPWYAAAMRAIVSGGASLAGALMVVSSAALAPSHRRAVTLVVFAIGTILAGTLAVLADFWTEAIATVLTGATTAAIIWFREAAAADRRV